MKNRSIPLIARQYGKTREINVGRYFLDNFHLNFSVFISRCRRFISTTMRLETKELNILFEGIKLNSTLLHIVDLECSEIGADLGSQIDESLKENSLRKAMNYHTNSFVLFMKSATVDSIFKMNNISTKSEFENQFGTLKS